MDILLTDLSKSFGEKTVLSHLSARFPQGECTGVMGPSGRGKTTLFQILLGLTPPDSGKIEGLDGLRRSGCWRASPPWKMWLLYCPEGFPGKSSGNTSWPWALGGANLFQCGS